MRYEVLEEEGFSKKEYRRCQTCGQHLKKGLDKCPRCGTYGNNPRDDWSTE